MAVAARPFVTDQIPEVPAPLRGLLRSLHDSAPDAVLVGGAVRDLLTGRTPRDLDIVTHADAREAAGRLARSLNGHAFALDEPRGQYRVTLDGAAADEVDISCIEDLRTDLLRRDFTVDALASAIREDGALGPVIDTEGGLGDLESGTVRMVSAANLADDPLRLLRAVRIATELQYEVEPETADTIRSLAPHLSEAAGERQRDELARILATPRAAQGVRLADALGLLDVVLPELAPARGVEQPKQHHYYDVFEHSVQALAALDEMLHDVETATERPWLGPDFREGMAGFDLAAYLREKAGGLSRQVLLKLATLLHDVSKPETKAVQADGRIRFFGHSEQGAVKAQAICERLRLGNRESRFVTVLIDEHLRPTQLSQQGELPSRRALYRFARDLGEAAPACLILSLADAAAARGPLLQRERWRGHVAYCRYVLYEAARIDSPERGGRRRLVTGHDLMTELGMEPGAALGKVLAQLDEAQAVGEIETREAALEYARRLGETPPPAPSPPAERGNVAGHSEESPLDEHASDDADNRIGEGVLRDSEGRWLTSPQLWDRLKPFAREHRHEPTPAEKALWERLRRNQVNGAPFRRQHAIGPCIVDFYCNAASLVIEVDGPIHERTRDEDAERQAFLESQGLTVVRFTNEQVLHHTDVVIGRIGELVTAAKKNPLSASGEGAGGGVAHD